MDCKRGPLHINTLSALDPRLVKDLLILQTDRDGIEQPGGIALKAGGQVTGLTVVMANGSGVIQGEVKYANGSPPAGVRVQLRVTRSDKVVPLTATEADARGRFRIERLPAGSYWLDVNAYLPSQRWRPPPSVRLQFDITNGSVIEIPITLVLSPDPAPD